MYLYPVVHGVRVWVWSAQSSDPVALSGPVSPFLNAEWNWRLQCYGVCLPCSPHLARCLCGAGPLTPRVPGRKAFSHSALQGPWPMWAFLHSCPFPLALCQPPWPSHTAWPPLSVRRGKTDKLIHPELGETEWEYQGFPAGWVVKNLPANTGDTRNVGWIPGLERSSEGGNGNPL